MAIAYKSQRLPSVKTLDFDISHWEGVNKVKGNQYKYEMADCKNMSSDNYPYASPRKPRELIHGEEGIKRIYKTEGDKIYYIDSEDYLCYVENGVKNYLTSSADENEGAKIQLKNVLSSKNYDGCTGFFTPMAYVDDENTVKYVRHKVAFGDVTTSSPKDEEEEFSPSYDGVIKECFIKAEIYVENLSARAFAVSLDLGTKNSVPYRYDNEEMKLVTRIYDADGNTKTYTDEDGTEHVVIVNTITEAKQGANTFQYVSEEFLKDEFGNYRYIVEIPDDIILEQGDCVTIRLGYFTRRDPSVSDSEDAASNVDWLRSIPCHIEPANNYQLITLCELKYATVFNNRIVGVSKSNIRASALGDFTNFWEYADSAGNPSATGAYATDVGSAGDFTGICVYNNMIMLFKRDIVYEMYGSMPYTIIELCTTGCIDNDSICEIDGVLYWASPKGIVRYTGGIPTVFSYPVDIDTTGICKAGTDGRKYYIYDGKKIFVYDTAYKLWHIEDDAKVKMFYGETNKLYVLQDDGIYLADSGKGQVDWEFETGEYTFATEDRKNLSKLWIRAEMESCSRVEVYVKQDRGEWLRCAVKTAEKDSMFDFKLRVKKCDSFALKFKGTGKVKILDVHGKVTVGTSKHRSGASLDVYRR